MTFILAIIGMVEIVGRWFVFKKLNVHPVWSLLPFIRDGVLYKKVWGDAKYCIAPILFYAICNWVMNRSIYRNTPYYLFAFVLMILYIAMTILTYRRLGKVFNASPSMVLGLTICGPFFILLLGLDKDATYDISMVASPSQVWSRYRSRAQK